MGCIRLPRGVKWCKSEGVKGKLTPHYYSFFGLPRGVKWCKSDGVKDKLPPNSYIVLPPFADQKRCKSVGLIGLLSPHSYTIFFPLAAQCSRKRRKSFELLFPKKSSHCSPTLTSFWAEKVNPSEAEQKCNIIELELFEVVCCTENLNYYLHFQRFTVVAYHRSLFSI